jgi:3-deoxy-D-manno-octulosonate 8-phosphate phosphatase KdsC-like HAD superfamily phosphatase
VRKELITKGQSAIARNRLPDSKLNSGERLAPILFYILHPLGVHLKKIALIALCSTFVVTSFAQAPAKPAASSVSMAPVAAEVVVITSTVDSVDVKKRIVTLKDDKGNTATMTVGKQINDLEKVKKGDLFVVEYAQALAVGLAIAPKDAKPGVSGTRTVTVAGKGSKKPFEEITDVIVATAKITSIDAAKRTAVLTLPSGEKQAVKVDQKVLGLEKFKVNDDVVVEYIDDMAIGFVTPPKK